MVAALCLSHKHTKMMMMIMNDQHDHDYHDDHDNLESESWLKGDSICNNFALNLLHTQSIMHDKVVKRKPLSILIPV